MIVNKTVLWFIFFILVFVGTCSCSWGDNSPEFRSCTEACTRSNCSHPSDLEKWSSAQSFPEKFIGWSCSDDCVYGCMWSSMQILFKRYGRVPQYFGRWPFIRILGLQEPASVVFSLFNFVSHLYMLIWFLRTVPSKAPMYSVWILYSLVSMNAWIWSSVFHSRDTPLTEMLDYFCAFSTVLCSLLTFCLRSLQSRPQYMPRLVIICSCLCFYVSHVVSMATVRFDYGYNMKVNITVGGINCACWLVWFFLNRWQGKHIKQGAAAVLAVSVSVLLELLEFPPILWSIDSHALWHLVTAPLPIFWYRLLCTVDV
ncbi:post-GPI attachment to proteins factor 3 isoform X2 [Eurytemora carolleeae]|uniref:post-GPI attachment to proteins factor 3 isoform X2 n=1 Tax=Eurytemora carolleeae TaxID=1294199 RepID=UPI000C79036A|nr:post-GPI attachment to proteins factor 3 isoform X2 [Eurytemora carolleeae]|eukprot:XP_023322124.1 post-GPI attachment to proteins factor 3-like isoform X2 [Eurytemora affinis]